MLHLAFFLTHLWHYFYLPVHGPWYGGQIWSNVFVIAVVAPLGWAWSKTKFWPLHSIHQQFNRLHARHDEHHQHLEHLMQHVEALHAKHDALAEQLNGGRRDSAQKEAQQAGVLDEEPPRYV